MKGIILAGGAGNRLYPMTSAINKQLLPVYDKPMVYYPLSTLMLAGIRDILIITTAEARPLFERLLGDGGPLGLNLAYAVQERPNGLPEAFIVGRGFLDGGSCAMILGDNIFHGQAFAERLRQAVGRHRGATVFAYPVSDPRRFGVVGWDEDGRVASLVEKPADPPSNWALTGLYFFDHRVSAIAAGLKPSARGELEIVDLMGDYLERGELAVEKLEGDYTWLDTGTQESLLQAAVYVENIERSQGLKIACVEEIALNQGFIDMDAFKRRAEALPPSAYGSYLCGLAKER